MYYDIEKNKTIDMLGYKQMEATMMLLRNTFNQHIPQKWTLTSKHSRKIKLIQIDLPLRIKNHLYMHD